MEPDLDKYKEVNIASIRESKSALKGKLETQRSKLEEHSGNTIANWKEATAKEKLNTAYQKIYNEFYEQVYTVLDDIDTVCDNVKTYNDAADNYLQNKASKEENERKQSEAKFLGIIPNPLLAISISKCQAAMNTDIETMKSADSNIKSIVG